MSESPDRRPEGSKHREDAGSGIYGDPNGAAIHYVVDDKGLSLLDVLLILTQNRRLIGITVAAAFALVGLFLAVKPEEPRYRASTTVIPESAIENNRLSGLGQLGLPSVSTMEEFSAPGSPSSGFAGRERA